MNVKIEHFDEKFFNSLPDKKDISYKKSGKYHTINYDGHKAGIVGIALFTTINKPKDAGFIQILIHPDFRGKGILQPAEDLVAKKYKLTTLFATIHKTNLASIKSHLKAGFEPVPEKRQENLRRLGFLADEDIRLVKEYK